MAPCKGVVLKRRLKRTDAPKHDDFVIKECDEKQDLDEGQVLVKTLVLSVDPYMRFRMIDDDGFKYMQPWKVDEICDGGGVGVVLDSKFAGLAVDDLVETFNFPWKTICKVEGKHLNKIEHEVIKGHPSLALGLLGVTGLTAYIGLKHHGHIEAGKCQTIVISGAAGACGSAAGQFARFMGATNVVGICGSEAKCKYITEELGFNHAINYKTDDIPKALKQACPNGADTFFDNVGGEISYEVFKIMNQNSHVVLCGQIATYNKDVPFPPPLPDEVQETVKAKNITRDEYSVLHHQDEWKESLNTLASWYKEGKIKSRETISEGIENMGHALVSVMTGGNMGKQLVKIA